MIKPDEDPAEVATAWASEIGKRLHGIVDGTTVCVPDSEVRARLRALRNPFIAESFAEFEGFDDAEVAEARHGTARRLTRLRAYKAPRCLTGEPDRGRLSAGRCFHDNDRSFHLCKKLLHESPRHLSNRPLDKTPCSLATTVAVARLSRPRSRRATPVERAALGRCGAWLGVAPQVPLWSARRSSTQQRRCRPCVSPRVRPA